jgi:ribosomal-protein-alanine N-acetyltransferase
MKTARLRLEPLTVAHAQLVLDYVTENRAYLAPWEPLRSDDSLTLDAQRRELARSDVDRAAGMCARFAAFEHDGSQLAAIVNLWDIRHGVIETAVLGYSVGERFSGRGYATEAAGAVVRHAFERFGLHRVQASYQPENVASERVLRKLGFMVEGYAREFLFLNGMWRDAVLTSRINRRTTLR